ncbi:hypothetical protein HYU16_02915 [Candidatus Woesearchaeota archaeon]|nr:hypothetical protein [Candidatus Woesearchaeota archaeon]
MSLTRFGKKGQEASPWGHLGGWIIALAVLIILVVVMLSAFGIINLDFIRNARFG